MYCKPGTTRVAHKTIDRGALLPTAALQTVGDGKVGEVEDAGADVSCLNGSIDDLDMHVSDQSILVNLVEAVVDHIEALALKDGGLTSEELLNVDEHVLCEEGGEEFDAESQAALHKTGVGVGAHLRHLDNSVGANLSRHILAIGRAHEVALEALKEFKALQVSRRGLDFSSLQIGAVPLRGSEVFRGVVYGVEHVQELSTDTIARVDGIALIEIGSCDSVENVLGRKSVTVVQGLSGVGKVRSLQGTITGLGIARVSLGHSREEGRSSKVELRRVGARCRAEVATEGGSEDNTSKEIQGVIAFSNQVKREALVDLLHEKEVIVKAIENFTDIKVAEGSEGISEVAAADDLEGVLDEGSRPYHAN
jgi:hypothetical protein